MLRPRIVPCLLVHQSGLTKTVGFGQHKYVGDPVNAVKIFNEKEADELIVLDIDASATGASPNLRMISDISTQCRMPLCYGGGVRTTADAKKIVGLGVEKVAVSSAAMADPSLVSRMSEELGAQSVVVVLDVRQRSRSDEYSVFTHNGKNDTGRTVVEAARLFESLGAGELVINSIDDDGSLKGYDLRLAMAVRASVSIPITILGGAGSFEHIATLIRACGVVGAAAGSLFVLKGPYRAVLITYPTIEQRDAIIRNCLEA